MSIIWSICIPTYNRADCLETNLNNIFMQINDEMKSKIEILVSNNCSTDNTDIVIKTFINNGNNISYYCNKENIGPDRNFLQCIDKAKGKYVLLLGDDDFLLNGSIRLLLDILIHNEYGMIYIANRPLSFSKEIPNRNIQRLDTLLFHDNNKFLEKVSYFITFMSGAIFNKCYLREIDYYNQFIGSYLIQITFFITAIFSSNENLYINTSILASRINDNGGYKITEVFGEKLNDLLHGLKPIGIDEKTISSINNDVIIMFLPYFVSKIRTEQTRFRDTEMKIVLDKVYEGNFWYYVILYPILTLPPYLAKLYSYLPRFYGKLKKMLS